MDPNSVDVATKVAWVAAEDVRVVVLDEGRRSLESAIAAGAALQGKLVLAAGLLAAAACLAAIAALAFSGPGAGLSAGAAVAFAAGGAFAFWAVRSRKILLTGVPPSWWADVEHLPALEQKDAHYWLAGRLEEAAIEATAAQQRRADGLYYALICGAVGGGLVALAAIWRVLGAA